MCHTFKTFKSALILMKDNGHAVSHDNPEEGLKFEYPLQVISSNIPTNMNNVTSRKTVVKCASCVNLLNDKHEFMIYLFNLQVCVTTISYMIILIQFS